MLDHSGHTTFTEGAIRILGHRSHASQQANEPASETRLAGRDRQRPNLALESASMLANLVRVGSGTTKSGKLPRILTRARRSHTHTGRPTSFIKTLLSETIEASEPSRANQCLIRLLSSFISRRDRGLCQISISPAEAASCSEGMDSDVGTNYGERQSFVCFVESVNGSPEHAFLDHFQCSTVAARSHLQTSHEQVKRHSSRLPTQAGRQVLLHHRTLWSRAPRRVSSEQNR